MGFEEVVVVVCGRLERRASGGLIAFCLALLSLPLLLSLPSLAHRSRHTRHTDTTQLSFSHAASRTHAHTQQREKRSPLFLSASLVDRHTKPFFSPPLRLLCPSPSPPLPFEQGEDGVLGGGPQAVGASVDPRNGSQKQEGFHKPPLRPRPEGSKLTRPPLNLSHHHKHHTQIEESCRMKCLKEFHAYKVSQVFTAARALVPWRAHTSAHAPPPPKPTKTNTNKTTGVRQAHRGRHDRRRALHGVVLRLLPVRGQVRGAQALGRPQVKKNGRRRQQKNEPTLNPRRPRPITARARDVRA